MYAYVGNDPISFTDPLGLERYYQGMTSGSKRNVSPDDQLWVNQCRRGEEIGNKYQDIYKGHHNDVEDARRHGKWSCQMAKELGSGWSLVLSTGYEFFNGNFWDEPASENVMDMTNNTEGRKAFEEGRPINEKNYIILEGPRSETRNPYRH